MKPNLIKKLWKEDLTASNAWISNSDSWTAELIAHQGFDAMTIDAQHGHAKDFETVLRIFQAMSATETMPFVRVPWNDPAYIMSMLDAGAMGIICPMINDRADTEKFVGACRYPQEGYRSYGPLRARAIHEGYFDEANKQIITMAMIETPDAFKNIEDIAQTPTLDGLFLGPWDLSISMGHPKVADFESDEMKNVFDTILNTCAKHKLKAGVHCGSAEDAKMFSEMGFRLVTVYNDAKAIISGAKESLKTFRG
ncbi:HpcH/HpaI aldolase/citrate lyase family protein [Jiulongibacter sediminis]|jgi:4-hydroxy-2-oxoheptanedioate aldolase|uniref:HpcH/HpaI aldolase family protein n=1 Tax=Jiulongibacter sediminis TaxID=1605367 RepID=UPI0026EA9949|nr:aldolase/citrate lyase family protein [Jiulongibacter sediminis]